MIDHRTIEAFELVHGKKDLSNFDNRLLIQKTIYLLKLMNIGFSNLKFTWFHRGPYCFEIAGMFHRESGEKLTMDERSQIDQKKEIIRDLMKDTNQAELHSSVAFLLADEHLTTEQVIEKMSLRKPWFEKIQVEKAIEKVSGLLKIPVVV